MRIAEIFKGSKKFKVQIHDEFLALGKVTIDVHESQVDVPHKMCAINIIKVDYSWNMSGSG